MTSGLYLKMDLRSSLCWFLHHCRCCHWYWTPRQLCRSSPLEIPVAANQAWLVRLAGCNSLSPAVGDLLERSTGARPGAYIVDFGFRSEDCKSETRLKWSYVFYLTVQFIDEFVHCDFVSLLHWPRSIETLAHAGDKETWQPELLSQCW